MPGLAISAITAEKELFSQLDFTTLCIGIFRKNWKWPFCGGWLIDLQRIDESQLWRDDSVLTENEKII